MIARLIEQRRELAEQQATEIKSAEARTNSAVGNSTAELNTLPAAERAERARVLASVQSQYVRHFLERSLVSRANIPGFGPRLKVRLSTVGVVTAADVSRGAVSVAEGIGSQRANALMAWRLRIENEARASMPNALPLTEDRRIYLEYTQRKVSLSSQIENHRRRLDDEKREIQNRWQATLGRVDDEIARARTNADAQLNQTREIYESKRRQLHAELLKANGQHASARRAIEVERMELERPLFQARLAAARREREFSRFRGITFRKYIARIVGIRKAR